MPRLLSALVVLLIALPATAIAQKPATHAPPGNSAIDEYLETVPGATGNQRPGTPGAGGSASGGLAAAQRARLQRLGTDGRLLANAVDATSPARATPSKAAPLIAQGRSPLGEVVEATAGRDSGAGMGVLLPAILLASLLGVAALVVMRRRSASR